MTLRDFFRLLIKLIGIYYLIQLVIGFLPGQFSFLFSDLEYSSKISAFIYVLIISAVCFGVFYFLIKNPDKIINWLKLDNNYDNTEININNFNSKNIIILGLFIIGGFLIIENLTSVISYLYYDFKTNNSNYPLPKSDNKMELFISSLNLILGFVLVIYRNNIGKYFEK